MSTSTRFVGVMLLGCIGMPAVAVETDFSGFASVGAGHINRKSLQLMDYRGDWSYNSDSVIGGQAIVNLDDRWSVTGQAIAEGFTYDNSVARYQVRTDWLFAGYQITPELRLRVGRMRTPIYMFSDSLEVGYSYPFVRPPTEVYANFYQPFVNFDGADLNWDTSLFGHETELGVFAGKMKGQFRDREADIKRMAGVNIALHADEFLWRYCYTWNRVTYTDPLFTMGENFFRNQASTLNQPILSDIADTLSSVNQVMQYHGVGVQWEHKQWSAVGEKFVEIGPDKQFSSDIDGWYVMLAHQYGAWQPFLSYGEYRSQVRHSIIDRIRDSFDVIPAHQPPALLDIFRNFAINALEDVSVRQRTTTLGVRWDFHPQADLKIQEEYYRMRSTGQMLFDNSTAMPDTALLTSVVLDVVF